MGLRENQDHRESLQTHKQRWKEVTKAIQSFTKCKCCTESKEWEEPTSCKRLDFLVFSDKDDKP